MDKRDASWIPFWIHMRNIPCLVVGGGSLAERRIGRLLEAGAQVTVISPEAAPGVQGLAETGSLEWHRRSYRPDDMDAFRPAIVFALTNNPAVNEQVRRDAHARSIWVNEAANGTEGSLIVPAGIRRGKLHFAVTTLGSSPALVLRIRRQLEEAYGAEYETMVDFLHDMRRLFQRDVADAGERARLNRRILDYPLLDLIRSGTFESWRMQVIRHWEEYRRLP